MKLRLALQTVEVEKCTKPKVASFKEYRLQKGFHKPNFQYQVPKSVYCWLGLALISVTLLFPSYGFGSALWISCAITSSLYGFFWTVKELKSLK